MSYPHDAPCSPQEFDIRDPSQFATLYGWAGSVQKLHRWLAASGVIIGPSTLNNYRNKFSIPVASDAYRARGGQFMDGTPPVDPSSDSALALLEYLRGRKVPAGAPPKVKVTGSGYATELVACDLHYPHHHRAAWEVFLGACEKIQPDGVTLNGDTLDFAQLGRYVRNPAAYTPLQQDIDEARELLARVTAAAPNARRTIVMGNHESGRWENYLFTRCPELASLRCLDFESVLGLSDMGWHYAQDGYWLIPDTLIIDHGSRHTNSLGGGSAQSARKEMLDIGSSGCSGHTHKLGMFWRQDAIGYRVWAEGGCLCDQDRMRKARVTAHKRGPAREDWHLGYLRIDYRPGGAFTITPVPIVDNGRKTFAIVDGEEIAA